MTKTTKTILWLIVAVIVIGGIWYGVSRKPAEEEAVKIGTVFPLTGPAAFIGDGINKAVKIAVDEINIAGGIDNRQIELIVEDSQSEGAKAVSAIQKLINIDKIDVLIGGSTYEMVPIAPIAEESKVPIITPCSSNPALTIGKDYVFRLMASDSVQGRWAAYAAYNQLSKKSAAILYTNDDWGVGIKNEFKDEFISLGGNITTEEAFVKGDKDLKSQLIKIRESNPEIIFFLGVEAETILGFKQMKELDINIPVLGGAAWGSPKIWEELGEIGEGAMYVRVHTETGGEFQEKYIEQTGSSQIVVCTPEAYDAVYVLKEAIEKAGKLNKTKIKDEIYKVKMDGASGAINFNSDGDRYPVKMGLFEIKESKAEEILVKDY